MEGIKTSNIQNIHSSINLSIERETGLIAEISDRSLLLIDVIITAPPCQTF